MRVCACVCVPSTGWIYRVPRLGIESCSSAWEAPVCSLPRVLDDFYSWGGRPREGVSKDGVRAAQPEAVGSKVSAGVGVMGEGLFPQGHLFSSWRTGSA